LKPLMTLQNLHDGWTVRAVDGAIPPEIGDRPWPATVPGTVHTDLMEAGLIPDPFLGLNEIGLAWLHRSSWVYSRKLHLPPSAAGERVDLVFDGLDTVATVSLGGRILGRTANMHRRYRFDVRSATAAPTTLSVRFDSALAYAEAMRERLGARPNVYEHPFNFVRKMACSFGWDWGPDLQTAGIWKPVRIERWRVARLAEVRPLATLDADGSTGRLQTHVEVERSGLEPARDLTIRVAVHGVTGSVKLPAGTDRAVVELAVPDAPVWWPAGYGEHPLCPVTVDLVDAGAVLQQYTGKIGFRSVSVDERPDESGSRFTFVVNGREVFVLGLNWIPEDHLLTRLTRERYAAAVDRAVAANANLLRIWGGGIYESDDFYDVCAERGVMVWQDFTFSCAAYPEEEPIRSEVLAEARENIARLATHASLVLWCGNNENIWGHEDWEWRAALDGATWGAGYYYEDFPALLAELDPTRPYHPGSPSSPGFDPLVVHPNDEHHGTRHEWEAWNRQDYTFHDRHVPRFGSEFGWQAPPAWATLQSALDACDLRQDSPAFLLHQKAIDGNGKLERGLAHHMRVPEDFGNWHWAMQLNQARATSYAVEHLRSHAPRTMGSILWQLNDCWPVTSWSVVDGDGRLKPAWYALRRAYAPRLLVLRASSLIAINDFDEPWDSSALIRRVDFDGTVLFSSEIPLSVAPRSLIVCPVTVEFGDASREVAVADADGRRAVLLGAEDFALAYKPEAVTAVASSEPGGYAVTVTAHSFARDITVLADRVTPDAVVDEQLMTLLPGESWTFHIRTGADVDPEAFVAREVLRSAFLPAEGR
jgi:beta-mannosidase